jgi:DNA polymerase-4
VLWIVAGGEAAFLAPLDVRKVPGVGKVMEKNLHAVGIRKVGDLARLDEAFLEQRFGKWGLALAGKSRGLDAGGWFDSEIGADEGPKSISHEHTFDEDTADLERIESTLARLSEMVGRRLREHKLKARTLQLKLRYTDFSTITRARSVPRPTDLDTEIFEEIRQLFRHNWKAGATVRLLGVHAAGWAEGGEQLDLLSEASHEKWQQTLAAADRMRDKFGESAVSLAASLRGKFKERTHENPASLPGRKPS